MAALRRGNDLAEENIGKSRSQKKRESSALQKHGEALAALSPAVWKKLPLSAELEEALAAWAGMKSWEAKRRQMQYIGRLMRELDEPEALFSALEELREQARGETAAFRHLEALRDALVHADAHVRQKALEETLRANPDLEAARLAHLVEGALAEREKKRPPRQGRALFRYLRDTLG